MASQNALTPPPPLLLLLLLLLLTQAIEELDGWGLRLDSGLAELSQDHAGRRLVPEKILFNKKTVVAGDDADWSRDAVKECQIVAVS